MAISLYPNIADRPGVREKVVKELLPWATNIREDRRSLLHERWLRYDRIWKAERDGSQGYDGRLKAYIPIGRRVLENWVQKLKQDLFPQSGKWFSISTDIFSSEEQIPTMETLFRKYFTTWMRLRRKASPYLRSLVTFGTVPIEYGWKLVERELPTLVNTLDPEGRPTEKTEAMMKRIIEYIGPTWRQVDLFLWYAWPNTAMDVEDLQLTTEDMLLDQPTLRRLAQTPIVSSQPDLGMHFENVQEALSSIPKPDEGSTSDEAFREEIRRLQALGLRSAVEAGVRNPNRPLDAATYHWKTEFDDDEGPEWYRIVVAMNRVPLQVRRVPWWHQLPNYLVGKFVEVNNEFYGYGLPGVFDHLQYFLNDVMNQAGDGLVWSMNPIAAIDPYEVAEPSSIRMRPAAKWLVRRPRESVHFMEPPKDTPAIGFTAMQQLIALMNDVSNVAPFGGGGIGGPRARGRALQTATGMQIIASEALIQVRDVVENQEDQVFNRMLQWTQLYTQQCLDRPLTLAVESVRGARLVEKRVTARDVIGDFIYTWMGSTNAYNLQTRTQQMLTYVQILARIPADVLQQQNVIVDWKYLLRSIWSDGFNLPDADRVLKEAAPMRSIDPRIENDLFRAGHGGDVIVSPADNDLDHAKAHDVLLQSPELPEAFREEMVAHIRRHMAQFLTKQLLAQQQPQLAGFLGGQNGGAGAGGVTSLAQPGRSGSPIFPGTTGRGMSTQDAGDTMRGAGRGVQ